MQTSEKTCFKCRKTKPLSDFYKHPKMGDGHLGKCKDCACHDVRENRKIRADYYRAYDCKRGNRMTVEDIRKQREAHPEWNKAHRAVSWAKKAGKLKAQPCECCGSSTLVHAHHDDYSKPLEVRWLCPLHHKMVHSSSQK